MNSARPPFASGRMTVLLLCALLLAACATSGPEPVPEPSATRVWPEPPDEPRIAYVRSFSRPADLGIKKSFFEKFVDFLLGPTETHLVRPMAVAAAADGTLCVADPGARAVQCFDAARGRYRFIQRAGDQPLPSPVGLAAGARGEMYVADSALAQVLVIEPGAKQATPLAVASELHQPTGVAFDPARKQLYVVDTAAHAVVVLGLDGARRASFGKRGSGDGEFNFPTLIWRDREGRLYVTDSLNFRIQMFDSDGKFLGRFGRHGDSSGDMSRPKGVATDSHGHVYVIDSMFHALQIFDRRGTFLLAIGGQGREPGEFWLPTGLWLTDNDTVYIADSHNQRVQVLRYIGGQP